MSVTRVQQMKDASREAFYNKRTLRVASDCVCYHCCAEFDVRDVTSWADAGETALCPKCGVDAVIPKKLITDTDLLGELREYWFNGYAPALQSEGG